MIKQCPRCGSEDIYYSKKRRVFVCEDCDHIFTEQELSDEVECSCKGLELFFSYGHDQNRILIERIKRDLEARGHRVWIDNSEIKVGDNWRKEIVNGLLNAASVIAFLSEHSTRNPGVCLDELKIAVCVKGANIKTVLLESENRIRPPATISDIQWLDMSQWKEIKQYGDNVFEEWYTNKFAQLCESVEAAETLEFTGDICTLKQILVPYVNSEKEYKLLAKPYYGRRWLEERIEHWQDRGTSKALVVYGSPGSGKSAFAVNYSHYNSDVYGCFLCEWNREYTVNPHKFVHTLAFRLAAKIPDYRTILLHLLSDEACEMEKMSSEALFEYLVSYPLNNLIDGNRETGLIIVDGLDEAEQDGKNPLAHMFAACIETLPRWIKFIFTSRLEYNVTNEFQSFDSIDIVKDIPIGYNDIMAYLIRTLSVEIQQVTNKLEILNRICELSEGVFQYAVTLVDDIKSGHISVQDVNSFPRGLNDIYRTTICRQFPGAEDFEHVRSFLEILCISETTPEELVIRICGYTRYEYLKLLEKLGVLVTHSCRENGLVELSFSHKSYSDWFVDKRRAGCYYVDRYSGACRMAHYASAVIDSDAVKDTVLREYIRNHVGTYYLEAGCYEELEQFLLQHTQQLAPFWNVWNKFPETWNHEHLLKAFWESGDRDGYLRRLQREGNTAFIRWILEQEKTTHGIGRFSRQMVTTYIDIVHLSGEYSQAVDMANEYLSGFSVEQIKADSYLSMLAVRKIHNAMFFRPVNKLIDNAMEVYAWLDDRFPAVYNELLFLLGGNLGVLSGNWEFSNRWLSASDKYTGDHGLSDFEMRNSRKIADCLCAQNRYEEAKKLICEHISGVDIITNRYEAYLTGALGNIYVCAGYDDEALQCFEALRKYTLAKGIAGWTAHAYLGIANVYFKLGNVREADDYANRAAAIYKRIHQEWGIIMSDALLSACESRLGCEPIQVACRRALDRAKKLHYGSCAESIEALCCGKTNYLKLYFL